MTPPPRGRGRGRGREPDQLLARERVEDDLVDPDEAGSPWYQRTIPLAVIAGVMVLVLNFVI